jgi:glycosyltransferase involved in cell wall biosynthesis
MPQPLLPHSQVPTQSPSEERSRAITMICCTGFDDPNWRWYVDDLPSNTMSWTFFYGDRLTWLEKRIRKPDLLRIRLSWQAIHLAKRKRAAMLFTQDTEMSVWCGVFARLLGVKTKRVAFSFNFPIDPSGARLWLMRYAFRNIERVVVSSQFECEHYHRLYHIPRDRFDFQHWRLEPPDPPAHLPIPSGEYICAMGSFARDNATLLEAMAELPEIKLVLVARPDKIAGLKFPPNVELQLDLSPEECMQIMKHSRFMVLPLAGANIACGHITLVWAMYLAKAMIASRTGGVLDYAIEGTTALLYEPFNAADLRDQIMRLWTDPALAERLGQEGLALAKRHCVPEAGLRHFETLLTEYGML